MPIPPGSKFPYQAGFELDLVLLKLYAPQSRIAESANLIVRIYHLYEPPSRACVMLVNVKPEDVERYHLPSRAILKVHDRRFQAERLLDKRLAWTWEKESSARQRWAQLAEDASSRLDYGRIAERGWREAAPHMEPALCEEYFQRSTYGSFLRETAAYERLLPMQGSCIPTLYATTLLSPSSSLPIAAIPATDDEFAPHALLMEYIPEADTLDNLNQLSMAQAESLRSSLSRMHQLGVRHCDLKPDNILINEDIAVLIDFGYADFMLASHEGQTTDQSFYVKCAEEVQTQEKLIERSGKLLSRTSLGQ